MSWIERIGVIIKTSTWLAITSWLTWRMLDWRQNLTNQRMTKDGEVVHEDNFDQRCGFKCARNLVSPDYCIAEDELGGNMSQKGDGHQGGQKYLCIRGSVPIQIHSNQDKQFTVLGFSLLSGEPYMFVY